MGKKFDVLKKKVYREYLKKGYTKEMADRVATLTASKVFWKKYGKKKGKRKLKKTK